MDSDTIGDYLGGCGGALLFLVATKINWGDIAHTAFTAFLAAVVGFFTTKMLRWLNKKYISYKLKKQPKKEDTEDGQI